MSDRITRFSSCRKYRYTLWREFTGQFLLDGHNKMKDGFVQFIGLNPSTADETKDDPTIRRCIGFAKSWGFGSLCMTNLFAWRSTDPSALSQKDDHGFIIDRIGPDNNRWLKEINMEASLSVAAWGAGGAILNRGGDVFKMLKNLHYLKKTNAGFPAHPLYLPKTLTPILICDGQLESLEETK